MSKKGKEWTRSTAEGRWCSFGPYYAMFPVPFAKRIVDRYAPTGGYVLDPFCGRGTVPFVAHATGKHSLGIDKNPVAWVYSQVKTAPYQNTKLLGMRLQDIATAVTPSDRKAQNEFQKWAWHPDILGFLHSARRNLDWQNSQLDRTIMGLILVHLHAKLGTGVSNQMRQSKAMAPEYAVNWWKRKNMTPPKINPVSYFRDRIAWRYGKGIVQSEKTEVRLADSQEALADYRGKPFDLLLTSPPYCGVTDYKYDNWIRLWMLGGPALPDCSDNERFSDRVKYRSLMEGVFTSSAAKMHDKSVAYVRTDARDFTRGTCLQVLSDSFPNHRMMVRHEKHEKSQTSLFGDHAPKPGEMDILLLPRRIHALPGFRKPRLEDFLTEKPKGITKAA